MEGDLLNRANNGDSGAQFQMYQNTLHENKEVAMQWLEKAAKGGNPKAQTVFGRQNITLYKNLECGCFWLESGLKSGDPDAALDLYHLYCEGRWPGMQEGTFVCSLNVGRAIQALEYAEKLYEGEDKHPAILYFYLQEAYIKQANSECGEKSIQKIVHYGEKTMQYDNDPERFLTEEVSSRTERYRQLMTEGKESKEGNGGCYIATCVYGSYDCPEVWTLRRFRDYKLEESWAGRAFIRVYYAVSPKIVKLFGKTKWFNHFWRGKLDCMVERLQKAGYEDTPYYDR